MILAILDDITGAETPRGRGKNFQIHDEWIEDWENKHSSNRKQSRYEEDYEDYHRHLKVRYSKRGEYHDQEYSEMSPGQFKRHSGSEFSRGNDRSMTGYETPEQPTPDQGNGTRSKGELPTTTLSQKEQKLSDSLPPTLSRKARKALAAEKRKTELEDSPPSPSPGQPLPQKTSKKSDKSCPESLNTTIPEKAPQPKRNPSPSKQADSKHPTIKKYPKRSKKKSSNAIQQPDTPGMETPTEKPSRNPSKTSKSCQKSIQKALQDFLTKHGEELIKLC